MNKTTKFLIATLGALTLSANAELVVNETFNYSTGTLGGSTAATGTGLTGNWAGTNTNGASLSGNAGGTIINTWSYTPPTNYAPAPSANQYDAGGSTQNSYASFTSNIATNVDATYYISSFFQVGTTGIVSSSYAQLGLMSTSANNMDYFNIGKGSSASTFGVKFGLDNTEDTGVAIAANTAYFVTAKLSINSSGIDSLALKFYTSADTLPVTEPVTWDYTATVNLAGSFTGIGFRNGSGQTNFKSDEFRLGTTWEAVAIPEPSTLLLVGVALGSVLLFRRRKA